MINPRLIILVVSMFLSSVFYGQVKTPKFKDTTSSNEFCNDNLLTDLINRSTVVATFRRYSTWTTWKEYKIISFQNDNRWHYHYSVHLQDTTRLFEVNVPQDSIVQLWKCIIDNKLTEINKEKRNDDICGEMIYDSHYYEFWIIARGRFRKILYYDPEYFEIRCSNDKERNLVIDCSTKFLHFSKKYK